MNATERTIIDQAMKYPNDYRNIEALAKLATQAINLRNELCGELLAQKATQDRLRMAEKHQ